MIRHLSSLQARLMLLMLVAALPAFAVIAYFTFWLRDQAVEQNLHRGLALARTLADHHHDHMQGARLLLAALAQVPAVRAGKGADCASLLADIKAQGDHDLSNLQVIQPDGRVLCSALPVPGTRNVADASWFRAALETKTFQVGEYHLSTRGTPVVALAQPVLENGQVVLVLSAALDLDTFSSHVEIAELPRGASYAIFDGTGAMLVHQPDRVSMLEPGMDGRTVWEAVSGLREAATFRGTGPNGARWLFAYAPLGPESAPYARLVVGIPEVEAFIEARQLLFWGLAGLLAAGVLGLAVGWEGSWRLVLLPLRPVFDTVRRVAAGDLNARTGVKPDQANELSLLAGEVDGMAEALSEQHRKRQRDEEVLRDMEQMLRLVTDTIPYHVFWKDLDSRYLGCNAVFARDAGLANSADIVGKTDQELVWREQAELYQADDAHVMASGIPKFNYEEPQSRPDGSRIWLETSKVPLMNGEGEVIGVLGLYRDITRRKCLEEERERLQAQLQQAQKMEALGQLTGGIAHDFNNMLGSILGFTKLALQRYVPDRQGPLAEYLGEVISAGERARDLVAKMLAFSRTRPAMEPILLEAEPLVKEVLRMLGSSIPSSIHISCTCEPDLPAIAIDPVGLHQILMNLVINARDAMDGKGSLEVGLRRVSHAKTVCPLSHQVIDGDFVELSVADNGQGIPAEIMARIFEPFFTTKGVGKGTGMGLAMVHGLVSQAGGHILVDSRPGEGSTFQVLFPAVVEKANPMVQEHVQSTPSFQGGGRLLVVDDEASLLRMLTATLQEGGYQVEAYENPMDALAAYRAAPERFVALITDQTMPHLTGAELTVAVHDLRPDLPVILCTGYSDSLDEQAALQQGVRRYFHKPVDSQELMAALQDLLEPVAPLQED